MHEIVVCNSLFFFGFISRVCVFRDSTFLGFSAAVYFCEQFTVFWWFHVGGLCFLGFKLSRAQ